MSIQGAEKKSMLPKESDDLSVGSDIPDDLNRKEKFKMVIGRAKREGQEQPSKESREEIGVRVDAAAAAAILQAARRGIKNPKLEILPRAQSLNGEGSHGSDSSQLLGGSLPPGTAIAETAAACEADSSEAGLTKEQKLKAERLKRAKMFTAMLKSGAVASKASPMESVVSGLNVETESSREREGSSMPTDSDATERNERRLKRSYRSRNKKQDEDDEEEEGEEKDEDGEEDKEIDRKHSRKKRHRSHRSSRHSKEKHQKHRKQHSSYSSKDKEPRHRRHRHEDSSADDEEHRHKGRSRQRHEDDLDSSSDGEDHRHWRHRKRRKHGSSDDDGHDEDDHRGRRSGRRHKRDITEREDLEGGGDVARLGESKAQSPTDQLDIREESVSSHKASETTEVPDDLRAKIRAMLMATM